MLFSVHSSNSVQQLATEDLLCVMLGSKPKMVSQERHGPYFYGAYCSGGEMDINKKTLPIKAQLQSGITAKKERNESPEIVLKRSLM